jgi:hypothetical protein
MFNKTDLKKLPAASVVVWLRRRPAFVASSSVTVNNCPSNRSVVARPRSGDWYQQLCSKLFRLISSPLSAPAAALSSASPSRRRQPLPPRLLGRAAAVLFIPLLLRSFLPLASALSFGYIGPFN